MKNKKRLLVIGATGLVAVSVLVQAVNEWVVHAVSRGPEPTGALPRVDWHHLDPLLPGELDQLFQKIRPDALIHTAALADIDFCQEHQELARAVNVEMTRNLANL